MKKNELVNQLIYRFMRIGLLPILLINCLCGVIYARPANGQEVLNRKINLEVDQKEVKSILCDISKLADVKFVYSVQKIPARKKVTINAHDRRLGDVLDLLFQPLDIFYYVSGNQVVLMRKGDGASPEFLGTASIEKKEVNEEYIPKTVTGKVTNETGDPLAGVSISVKGTQRGTTTNGNGVFSINADIGETLEFTMVGFKTVSVKLTEDKPLNLQMQSEISS